ncbi:MAG: DUF115 domain-containing protein [Candidatus Pacebacteria bacterium]|nr:DUF115 domain-containing protein [Candidatus Paceibacterota bacterium]
MTMDILEYSNKIHANIEKHKFPYVGMVNNQLIGHTSMCKHCYQCGKIKAECTNPKNESKFCFFSWYSGGKIDDYNCYNYEANPYWRSVSNDYFYNRKASIIDMENQGIIPKIEVLDPTDKKDISEYFFKPYSVFVLTDENLDEEKLKKDHPILSSTPVEKLIVKVPRIEDDKELFDFLLNKIRTNLKLAFMPHLVLDVFKDEEYNLKVKHALNDAFSDFLCDVNTRLTQARPIQINEIMNMSWLNYSYSWVDFKDSLKDKGKSILCISGGPTINSQIEWIKLNRDKFIVFCVATIAEVLFKNGITPDLIGTIEMKDSNKAYLDVLKKYDLSNTYLLFEIDSFYDTVNTYEGDKIMVCADSLNLPITNQFFNENNSIDFQKHGTVAGLIYSFACLCSAKDIYLCGYDLSYNGTGLSHAAGTKDIHRIEVLENNGNYFVKDSGNLYLAEKTTSNDGSEIYTQQQFKTYKLRIEQEIEKYVIPTYNLADKGIKIEGCVYKKLDDVELEDCNFKLKDIAKNFNKKKIKDRDVKETLLSLYDEKYLIYENHYVIYSYIINQLQLNPTYNIDELVKKLYLSLKEKSEKEIKEYVDKSIKIFENRKINEKKLKEKRS